jgi:hypothetical protein
MGSNTLFARNVQFETSFPTLGDNEMVRNAAVIAWTCSSPIRSSSAAAC